MLRNIVVLSQIEKIKEKKTKKTIPVEHEYPVDHIAPVVRPW